jgi:hypothetical protein
MRYDIESQLVEVYNKIIDPNTGLNYYIGLINADKAAQDTITYGAPVVLKTIVLPDPTATPPEIGATFLLVASQYAINYDPFVSIALDEGGYTLDDDGMATLTISIRLIILDPADGLVDFRALRYLEALRMVIEYGRWTGETLASRVPFISAIEPKGYKTVTDNKSYREIGITMTTEVPTR